MTAEPPRVFTPVSSSASGCLQVKPMTVVDEPLGPMKPRSVSREPTACSRYVWTLLLLLPDPEGSPQTAFICQHLCRNTRGEGAGVQGPVGCKLTGVQGSHNPTNKPLRKTFCVASERGPVLPVHPLWMHTSWSPKQRETPQACLSDPGPTSQRTLKGHAGGSLRRGTTLL